MSSQDIGAGAANSAYRVFNAIKQSGVDAEMFVQWKYTDDDTVMSFRRNILRKVETRIKYGVERLQLGLSQDVHVPYFSLGLSSSQRNLKYINCSDCDVVNLHWLNAAFLNIRDIAKINKPIVWTMHDMWPFTGGCHYSGNCTGYEQSCNDCPYLQTSLNAGLSLKVHRLKTQFYGDGMSIVASSRWLGECAMNSSLFKRHSISVIPTPVPSEIYHKRNRCKSRQMFDFKVDKKFILFGASNVYDKRKGFDYLARALEILMARYAEEDRYELVIFGAYSEWIIERIPCPVRAVGIIEDEPTLAYLYSACDILVVPSLEENLSNIIIEGVACGTPVVAFDIGGNGDIIKDQVNGSLVPEKSAEGLASAIEYWSNTPTQQIGGVELGSEFSSERIASEYKKIYKSCIKSYQ